MGVCEIVKTGNQQKIQYLEEMLEKKDFIIKNLQKKVEMLETQGIWDEVKNRENIKHISEEIILWIDKAFRGRNEIKVNEGSNPQ